MLISLDEELLGIIFVSLKVSIIALFCSSLIALPLGVMIGIKNFKGKGILINCINSLMSLPPVVAGLVVYILLSNKTGFLGEYKLLFTVPAMCIAQFFLAFPLILGLSVSAIMDLPKSVLITAKSLGATYTQRIFVLIKEARFGLISALIIVFGRLLAEVGAVMMVGGNIRYETRTMTTAIALQKGMGEFEKALALGIILIFISFLINAILEIFRNYRRVTR